MKWLGEGIQSFKGRVSDLPFRARRPWVGADLQTIYNRVRRTLPHFPASDRWIVPVEEMPQKPTEKPIEKVIEKQIEKQAKKQAISVAVNEAATLSDQAPTLILAHGLGGSEDSIYMQEAGAYFHRLGWNICRLNYRGVGPSADHSSGPYHAGLIEDLWAVVGRAAHVFSGPIALLGFSLGGHKTLRLLCEMDTLSGYSLLKDRLVGAVTVSAPLDLATCQARIEAARNFPYRRYLTRTLQAQFPGFPCPAQPSKTIESLGSVREIDDQIIGPFFGFGGADAYYSAVSCLPHINKINLPCLAVHAANDPWIPVKDYERANWPAADNVGAVISADGGHVGFHGGAAGSPWYLEIAQRFYNSLL